MEGRGGVWCGVGVVRTWGDAVWCGRGWRCEGDRIRGVKKRGLVWGMEGDWVCVGRCGGEGGECVWMWRGGGGMGVEISEGGGV